MQPEISEQLLPPAVSAEPSGNLGAYWLDRLRAHELDHYAGVGISKFPEDLRVYEHLLWIAGCDTVVEIGSLHGGSALWFRDRLTANAGYGRIDRCQVVTIDVNAEHVRDSLSSADPEWERTITLVESDVRDPGLPERVSRLLAPAARVLVVEDSAHEYETTMAALIGFARFVPAAGYLVVEDGCVDVEALRSQSSWPRGVRRAIDDWLASDEGSGFRVRRDLERYGISCHIGGYLQRTRI
jgi:cephalosporin hydroxylase